MSRLFRKGKSNRKVFVIGLDCASPELVFDRWTEDLPNLKRLMENGLFGDLESTIPAITVPAWSSMLTSCDPGVLGFYGFRNRADYSYDRMSIAMGNRVREKRVWDYLGEAGLQSVVLGVPQTYPVRPLKGLLVSGFLTPNQDSDFAYPPSFRKDLLSRIPDFAFDVKDFRTDDKDRLLTQINQMTRTHFKLTDWLLREEAWDFFMTVEIGVDRMHHAFWHFQDTEHPKYTAGNPYESVIHDYYVTIDRKIGEWMETVDDKTVILVVSDHGAKRMDGGICVNEWLWRKGYLAFKEDPVPGTVVRFEDMEVDWKRTKAWGSGGYYGRIFLNVKGREPDGVIDQRDYTAFRDTLAQELIDLKGPEGEPIGTRVFRPQDVYREVKHIPPDLIVYFGDLTWRSVGSMGYDGFYTYENDTGPDSCNHAVNGMFILYDPEERYGGIRFEGAHVMDIAPTILNRFGLRVPKKMQGKPHRHQR